MSAAAGPGVGGSRAWRLAPIAFVVAGCAGAAHVSAPPRPAPVPTPRSGSPSAVATHAVVSGLTSRHLRFSDVARPGRNAWTVLSRVGRNDAVDGRAVTMSGGVVVTVYRFRRGLISFVLHAGSADPGRVPGSAAGSRVTAGERPRLLAAFNGAFKVSAGTGGYVQDGRVVTPLRHGLATFIIDNAGRGSVGVWPQIGMQTNGVRSAVQNLRPLIDNGHLSPNIDTRLSWGATLGHVLFTARSAVATDASGNILYAASMSASPPDLAGALLSTGAVEAMELDINPEWVQLDLAPSPGAPLHVGVPGQYRPAAQLLTGWTRSFIAVLAAG